VFHWIANAAVFVIFGDINVTKQASEYLSFWAFFAV
jgi:hypothetical protein